MKQILHATVVLAVCTVAIAACDATPPPDTSVARPVAAETARSAAGADAIKSSLTDVIRDPDAYSRARRLGTLLPTLGPEAVPAVKATLADPTLDFDAGEVELLVRFWATHEPEAASHWAVADAPPGFSVPALLASVPVWAEADPQAAARTVERWRKEYDLAADALMVGLVRGWFRANPEELAEYIDDLGMGFPRQRALSTYIRALIQSQGIAAALSWAESVPGRRKDERPYKLAVYRQIAAAVPLFDLDAGLRWCEAHCDGPFGDGLRGLIARRWVRVDGPAALAWLAAAPEGHERDQSLRVTYSFWAQIDREAALAWMTAQMAGGELKPWLMPMLPVYASVLAEDSPADAIAWAERIEVDDQREWTLIEIARRWREIDEYMAEAWLQQSELSEEARTKARTPSPRRGPGG